MKDRPKLWPTKSNLVMICILVICISIEGKGQQLNICHRILDSLKHKNEAELDKYVKQLQSTTNSPCVLQLFPRYYWGQNMSHILVKFQFLNSADTSACDRVLSVLKNVQHNAFSLSLICTQSNFILRYKIVVTTMMPLNFYQAVWKQADQNTIILQCMKSPNPYFWKTLYLPAQPPMRKPKVWWKIIEKYIDNLKKFINDLDLQDEEIDVSSYVKKRKKIRQTKQSIQLEPFSKKYLYCNQNSPFELASWIV